MPEVVWNLITSEKFVLTDWVLELDGPITPQTGFSLSIKTAAIPGTAFAGHFDCQFLNVRPNEQLAFRLTSIAANPRTFHGIWALSQAGDGTNLSFTLSGFASKPLSHVPVHRILEKALERLVPQLPHLHL
ncbi:SRPBCC domain-containing protein [Mycobacteroides sp. LB1]|uniref:SRPBCC family protein n=1 Tax=Mycobacteroides sp. LB1 TaxID=2750814 RepID=UPI0015DE6A7B|nr:SRPBCC domain-containing protein [Mycobacteroides sp. LB1]